MADLINHPLIAERYFFPGGRAPTSRLDVSVDDAVLACGIHRVDPDGFTVVFFHGNGEVVADWQGTLDKIVGMLGWDLLLAEYRGYGASTGHPLLGVMLDDVGAVIDAAGPPEKVVVMGRSVGSFFALEAVSRFPTIAGLILESASPIRWNVSCCGFRRRSWAARRRTWLRWKRASITGRRSRAITVRR